MHRNVAAQMFDNLVTQAGGKEAAASLIEAAVGHKISIGTLTKIKNGDAEVPLLYAWALMNGTKNFCFDSYRTRVLAQADHPVFSSAYALSGEASKEAGDAVSAGIRAEQSTDCEDWATAAVESREAEAKFGQLAAYCEDKATPRDTRPVPMSKRAG